MFFKMANLKFAQKLSNFFRDYRRIEKTGGENTLIWKKKTFEAESYQWQYEITWLYSMKMHS